jgi:hypothetical protein
MPESRLHQIAETLISSPSKPASQSNAAEFRAALARAVSDISKHHKTPGGYHCDFNQLGPFTGHVEQGAGVDVTGRNAAPLFGGLSAFRLLAPRFLDRGRVHGTGLGCGSNVVHCLR